MTAPPSLTIGDLEFAYYKAAVPIADLNDAETLGQGIVTTNPQTAAKYQSVSAAGTVTAPGAGATVATLAIATAGYYQVDVSVGFGGTAETAALDNFTLKNGAAGVGAIPVQNVANNTGAPYRFYLSMAGGTNIVVTATAAGSAGAIYKAGIVATRIA